MNCTIVVSAQCVFIYARDDMNILQDPVAILASIAVGCKAETSCLAGGQPGPSESGDNHMVAPPKP